MQPAKTPIPLLQGPFPEINHYVEVSVSLLYLALYFP